MNEKQQAKLQELVDREEIYQLSCVYCRGLDRLDRDLLRSVYFDDATDDRGFITGGPDPFCDFAIEALRPMDHTHHQLGNTLIEIEGDVAFGELYFTAQHRLPTGEDGEEQTLFIAGRYVDRYERRDGIWKIAHRSELNDWCRTVPAADGWFGQSPDALRGARGSADLTNQRELLRDK